MPPTLTKEQVLALAPDDASAKAASGLLSESKWLLLGADDEAAWGECKGSGAKPYQTQVDLAALATKCSCPSRKFPCKHGLALLLIHAQRQGLPALERPPWVGEWLASRQQKAAKKEQAATAKAPVDQAAAEAAAAKREALRWKRIEAGSADLQRWIADQFRHGLGSFGPEQRKEWIAMAARMVDAQAPDLGQQVLDALAAIGAGSARQEEAIERLGLIQLANAAVERRMQLSPARLADLRTALGWPCDRDDVVATATTVEDDWLVLGQVVVSRDKGLNERRVWLRGRQSGRFALLLDFTHGGRGWEAAWIDGASYRATLGFYPGSVPLRALASTRSDAPQQPCPVVAAADAMDQASHQFANNPWLPQVPMLLSDATPMRQHDAWIVHTAAGAFALRLHEASAWSLLAFSGGHGVNLMGEWDGRALRPLSAVDRSGARWSLDREEVAA